MTMRVFGVALLLLGIISVSPLAAAPAGGVSTVFHVTGEVTDRASFDSVSYTHLTLPTN